MPTETSRRASPALRLAAAYALFGLVWIAGSDRILEAVVRDPHRMTVAQTYKGWAFVAGSTLLLFWAARREFRGRERAEEAQRRSESLHRALAESTHDLVLIAGPDGRVQYVNPAGAEVLDTTVEAAAGRPLGELFPAQEGERLSRQLTAVLHGASAPPLEVALPSPRGPRWFEAVVTGLRGGDAAPHAALAVGREITGRKRAEATVELQMQRLSALRTIDVALTGSLDLRITLDVVLSHVTSALGVDAACVLLLAPHSPVLEYASGRGFRTAAAEHSSVRLGEGFAGRAALERKRVELLDVAQHRGPTLAFGLLEKEGFSAYVGVPLAAKGQVKGVLEIFHRTRLDPPPDWFEFLEALATDAAIAIDNASLFDELQRANAELTLAYDATLEGWGRALELRDEETEGHTERVTAMTVRLARAMGVSEADLVHIRRGSFLHDIGKIGIPDRILLKTEPLTPDEWNVMRMHPVYAFRLLHPIRYLRPALDIPYAHHEHWDGSGYPRGLAGEQIPKAARIFTVVDVWDALVSRRPYHPAWEEARVREHLAGLTGSQFDPAVVEAFLALDWGGS